MFIRVCVGFSGGNDRVVLKPLKNLFREIISQLKCLSLFEIRLSNLTLAQ